MALLLLLTMAISASAQDTHDSVLFTAPLPKPLLQPSGTCESSDMLYEKVLGPVVMSGPSLLICSPSGYALYDTMGAILDSHTVATADSSRPALRLAFPLDSTTLLYTRSGFTSGRSARIYRKQLHEPHLNEIAAKEYRVLGCVVAGVSVNIACNASSPSAPARLNLRPFLIGFRQIDTGARWWSLNGRPHLGAPVLFQDKDKRGILFRGAFAAQDTGLPPPRTVELRGSFELEGRRAYMGLDHPGQSDAPTGSQTVYLCDHAGNVLYTDTIFAYGTVERMVRLFSHEGKNIMGYVRDIGIFGSAPVVDAVGRIYYGIVDQKACSLSVHRLEHPRYHRRAAPKQKKTIFATERSISFATMDMPCSSPESTSTAVPNVFITGPDDKPMPAEARDLTRSGFVVRVGRKPLPDRRAKLARVPPALPASVKHLFDSVAALSTASCPWILSLAGPTGTVRTFAYGPGERVACARVLGVLPRSKNVALRVDLLDYAEILLFTRGGAFANRFIFNRQPAAERRDLLTVRKDGTLIERDYENDKKNATHYVWAPER